ncbi:NADPH dehydrogenase [Xylariales sp. PMI_506]|nr:NADPH dehydrogenase [Xylariales sp. PMI_506]
MADSNIASPLTLKCGLTLPNRLVKAAMAECMAGKDWLPDENFQRVYAEWAKGGWGMVLTGNVQVDTRYLGDALDVAYNDSIDYQRQLDAWKAWAKVCNSHGTPTVVQINHPGRQSPLGAGSRGIFVKNLAPSAIPMDFGPGVLPCLINTAVFGTPKEMTVEDIQDVVKRFAATARLSAEAGFAGAEIHAAHGYLLAQFLSEKSNQRTDEYGGSPAARAKIIVDIYQAMRAAVPENFCIGIKLNSVDHQSPTELAACLEQLKLITAAGVDFLEISGGSYEDPTMNLGPSEEQKSKRTKAREAFFLEFAEAIRKEVPDVPLMVTGGLRSRQGVEAPLREGHCDLIGIGRAATLTPSLPKDVLLNPKIADEDAILPLYPVLNSRTVNLLGVKALKAASDTMQYRKAIQKLGA